MISNGTSCYELGKLWGMWRSDVYRSLIDTPEAKLRYARARDEGFDAIAERALVESRDPNLDAKDRRIRLEAATKLLAVWCPARYGASLMLKAMDEGRAQLTDEQIVEQLALMMRRPVPLSLPLPDDGVIDAEFTTVGE